MRKLLMFLAIASMAFVLFAGGQQGGEIAAEGGGGAVELTPPGTFPIVAADQAGPSLSIMVAATPGQNMDDNWFTQFYEEKTNVDFTFETAPYDQFREKMNLAFASGDYADVIAPAGNSLTILSKDQELKFGQQGIFRPLNDLIDSQSVWFKKVLTERPELKDFITTPEGQIYSFPQVEECFHCMYSDKMYVNMTWLERLGLEVPTTVDEFEAMLVAFRDEDANGNGDPNDELPFSTCKGGANVRIDGFLMAPFQLTAAQKGWDRLYMDEGVVKASFTQPGYREGLKWLARLWDEELIYQESFTQDRNTQKNLNESGEHRIIGSVPAMHAGYFSAGGATMTWTEYEAIKPLKGPDGRSPVTFNYEVTGMQSAATMITTNCDIPEVAFRVFDWFWSWEGVTLMDKGQEDLTWRRAEPGEVGLDGEPARIARMPDLEEDHPYYNNMAWGQRFTLMRTAKIRAEVAGPKDWRDYDHPNAMEKYYYDLTAENYKPFAATYSTTVPNMYYTTDMVQELSMLKTSIIDFVDESVAAFVSGKRDVDADWDRYLKELESIGLSRYIELIQQSYDAQYK